MWETCLEEKSVDMASECDAGLSSVGLTLATPENVVCALPGSLAEATLRAVQDKEVKMEKRILESYINIKTKWRSVFILL